MDFYDQAQEDAEYEANARFDYVREAFAATAEDFHDEEDFEGFEAKPAPAFTWSDADPDIPF